MTTGRFKAEVQYGDWKGTSAADRSDSHPLENWLEEKKLKHPHNEFLLGAKLSVGESHGGKMAEPYIEAFIFEVAGNADSARAEIDSIKGPIPVRKIDVAVSLEEFIGMFKRFDVMLTNSALGIGGREWSSKE